MRTATGTTGLPGKPIIVSRGDTADIVISPDGTTAWVTVTAPGTSARGYAVRIDLGRGIVGRPVEVGRQPVCLLLLSRAARGTPATACAAS